MACRAAEVLLRDLARRLPDEKQQGRATAGAEQLARLLATPMEQPDFHAVASSLLSAPGVHEGFLQQTVSLEELPSVRAPGGAGVWIKKHVCRDTYRVFLNSGKKHAEATHADLLSAVADACERAEIDLPEGLRK
jgi:hypothetical protein